MLGHECFDLLGIGLGSSVPSSAQQGLFAYVGLGAGPELLPYVLAIVAWAGAALVAVLQWPLAAFLRRRKGRARKLVPDAMLREQTSDAMTSESRREVSPVG